jgi:D-alanyl-D-alanine carboxypeptidase/D-alanyl-D-alanine-endopeptidase (penicillin-binding protein 4)
LDRRFSATTSAGGKLTLGFDARPSGLIVRGTIPRGSAPYVDSCAVSDPVVLFADVFRHELAARGVLIEGPTLRQRDAPSAALLTSIRTPLLSYLSPINQESNNAVADQLFLAMAQATQGNAARDQAQIATLEALRRLGVADEDFRQVDGSGLSDQNRVSARQLTALIHSVLRTRGPIAERFHESLAVAGVSGTLEKRMRNTPAKGRVFAKTGFIDGTSALSGVARDFSDNDTVFAILVEYREFGGLNSSVWKPMEDEICELLVGQSL